MNLSSSKSCHVQVSKFRRQHGGSLVPVLRKYGGITSANRRRTTAVLPSYTDVRPMHIYMLNIIILLHLIAPLSLHKPVTHRKPSPELLHLSALCENNPQEDPILPHIQHTTSNQNVMAEVVLSGPTNKVTLPCQPLKNHILFSSMLFVCFLESSDKPLFKTNNMNKNIQ